MRFPGNANAEEQPPDWVGELFDAYGAQLFQYCWLMLRSRGAAHAAVRDTMLAAQVHIGRLADPELLAPWLCALARAACRRYDPLPPERADEPPARRGDPDAVSKQAAWRAVMRLTPDEREVLDLTARYGMAPVDIGLVTGLNDVAAAVLVVQAQTSLRGTLAAELGLDAPLRVISVPEVYGLLPVPAPLPGMREAVLAASRDPGQVARAASFVPPLDGTGFPHSLGRSAPPHEAFFDSASNDGGESGSDLSHRTVPLGRVPLGGGLLARPLLRRLPFRHQVRGRVPGRPQWLPQVAAGMVSAGIAAAAVFLLWVTALSTSAGTSDGSPSANTVSGSASGIASASAPVGVTSPKTPEGGKGGGIAPASPVPGPLPGDTSGGQSMYMTAMSPSSARLPARPGSTPSRSVTATSSAPASSPPASSAPAPSASATVSLTPSSSPSAPPSSAPPTSPPPSSAPPTSPPPSSAPPSPTPHSSASPSSAVPTSSLTGSAPATPTAGSQRAGAASGGAF